MIDDERWVGALPSNPLNRHAVGASTHQRSGYLQSVLTVGEMTLEAPDAVLPDAPLAEVAARMRDRQSGILPVQDARGALVGAIYIDDLLVQLADGRLPAELPAKVLMSAMVPACTPESALADAVRQMLSGFLLRLPVVARDGRLLGQLSLSEAVAGAAADPAVRDLLTDMALAPSLWARRWR